MTLSLTVQDPTSDKAGKTKVTLPAEVFDVPTNVALIHQVVVAQLAAARQGSASTKTRGDVRGGGKKPYRQKGTGRARQGSTRAPQFTGGGIVHGPQPRAYDQRTPKKMKAAALRGALSDRARNERVHVVSALVSGATPSTRTAAETLAKVTERRHVLVVAERSDELTWKSLRNVPTVHLLEPGQLNTYDVLISDDVIFTQAALEAFLAGPAAGKSAKGAASSLEIEVVPDDVVEETVEEPKPAKKTAAGGGAPTVSPGASTSRAKKAAPKAEAKAEEASEAEAAGEAEASAEGPYGPDSHAALEDGEQPEGFPIKGNASSKLYHVPGSSFYNRTVAEVWFRSAEAAEAAGFQLPPSQRAKNDDEEDAD
ncbi:MAG TPA: 50S ribosomal protein L4 [Jatrophihabitantaceae bacterium]|jgi:large subunit ribosomal protein L4